MVVPRVRTVSLSVLLVTFLVLVNAACDEILAPCTYRGIRSLPAGGIDGVWSASTIDGQPAANFQLPLSNDRFQSGAISFRTQYTDGTCDDPKVSRGMAYANYQLSDGQGTPKKPKRYTGRFRFDHETGQISLTAAGYEINGSVLEFTMTLPASHALFGTYTLVLTRN